MTMSFTPRREASILLDDSLASDAFDFPDEAMPTHVPSEADRGAHQHQWHRGFASIGIPMSGLQTTVEATELADGAHYLTGGTHHSLVIEQANGVVVFDAPMYAQRCLAILDWIETNLSSAPVTHVVISHYHQDHSACARTFVAEGSALVVGEDAKTAWDKILVAPSTLIPDALAMSPVNDPTFVLVPDGRSITLDDATNPITIYDLESEHAEDMLLPFVDSAGILFSVDLFSPNLELPADNPQEVIDALETHGITDAVNLVVGGHGSGTATVDDIVAATQNR